MSLTLDLSDDYLSLDGPETIAHVSRRTSGDLTQTGVVAIPLPLQRGEAALSGGVYTVADVIWSVQGDLLDREPKPGDWLTDGDSTRWVIQSIGYSALTREYQLTTKNLVLAEDLHDLVSVFRPTYTADAAGSAVPSYGAALYTDLVCRIQESDGLPVEERGKLTTERRFTIYFADRIEVRADDQIRDGATVYQVLDYRDPDRIDALMAVNVIRKL